MTIVSVPSLLTCTDSHDFAAYKRHGYEAVWYQTWNAGGRAYASADACRAAGLDVCAWGVIYEPDRFYADGKQLAVSAGALGARHLMVDAEDCLKGTRATRAAREIVRGFRDGGWSGPVHLTTLGAPTKKPDGTFWDYEFDLDSFLETGGGIFPQAYANQDASYAPKLCIDYFCGQLGVPRDRVNLMIWLDGTVTADSWRSLLEAADAGAAFSVFLAEFFAQYGYGLDAFDQLRPRDVHAQPALDPRLPQIRNNTLIELGAAELSYEAWKSANPAEAVKVEAYLAAIANGDSAEPPSLETHEGRGIIGVLQAGAATIGRLP